MIDLELYKIFVVVADCRNITRASNLLHISQPAVSKHIKKLEEQFQVKLINRSNYGIELTEVGKFIYDEIKEHVHVLDFFYDKYKKTKNINLGIHDTMLDKVFGNKIVNYYAVNESVKINIINLDTLEMLTKLEKQELDLVVSKKLPYYENEMIDFIKVGELHDIFIISSKSLLRGEILSIEQLKNKIIYLPRKRSVTVYNFYNCLKLNEKDFKLIRNISYFPMMEIIENTDSVGVVTLEYVFSELESGKVMLLDTDFELDPIEYGIYINKNNNFRELGELIEVILSKA